MKEGRRWVNMPQREYQDRETGEKKYANSVKIPDQEHYKAFQKMAKEAIDKWVEANPPTIPQMSSAPHMTEYVPDQLPF